MITREDILQAINAYALGVEEVKESDLLSEIGLDSLDIAQICQDFNLHLSDLDTDDWRDLKTVAGLADTIQRAIVR